MAFRKRALPSAKKDLSHFCETYGEEFTKEARAWVDKLITAASANVATDTFVTIDQVLDEILSDDNHSDAKNAWECVSHSKGDQRKGSTNGD